jgi:hypothetical protein
MCSFHDTAEQQLNMALKTNQPYPSVRKQNMNPVYFNNNNMSYV